MTISSLALTQEPIRGHRYTHTDVNSWIGGNWQKGIRYSGTFPELRRVSVVITDSSPYHDNPSSGEIRYVGEGLRGDQHLAYGNRALVLRFFDKEPVPVFIQVGTGIYEAQGNYLVVSVDASIERDSDDCYRGAFVFTLKPEV